MPFIYKAILQIKKAVQNQDYCLHSFIVCSFMEYLQQLIAVCWRHFKLPPMALLSTAAWASRPGGVNSSPFTPPLAPSPLKRAFSHPQLLRSWCQMAFWNMRVQIASLHGCDLAKSPGWCKITTSVFNVLINSDIYNKPSPHVLYLLFCKWQKKKSKIWLIKHATNKW